MVDQDDLLANGGEHGATTMLAALQIAGVNGTLAASLGPLIAVSPVSISSAVTGFGDLYPQAYLKWNQGVHNFMIYGFGDIPVGAYELTRLANLGIGHGAADAGAGYTYFDAPTGHEFSAARYVDGRSRISLIRQIDSALFRAARG